MGNWASSSPPSSPGAGPSSPPPSSPGAGHSSPPPPPAALPKEIVEEILLRLPPDEPASLFRAALVCKPWCRLISGSRFRRRFREFHRTPPMLGFLRNTGPRLPSEKHEAPRFVPTTAFRPPGTCPFDWEALDAHHGRVLGLRTEGLLVVWDPITNERWELTVPWEAIGWSAAVVCARTTTGACSHLDCHGEPFLVVFVGCDPNQMFVCTYSSDVKAWSEPVSTEHPDPDHYHLVGPENQPVLVGNALYFGMGNTNLNLKYNLESQEMSLIQLPSPFKWSYLHRCMLITTYKGVLGLITVDYSEPLDRSELIYKLCIWLMDTPEVDAEWTQSRVIDLTQTILPHGGSPNVVGVTNGLGTLFMMVESDLYTIDLKTCMVEKYNKYQDIGIKHIIPYMSFYTPELEAACAGEGSSEGGLSA